MADGSIYAELRRLIVSGRLAEPNRITESAIVDLLAVSRTRCARRCRLVTRPAPTA